MRTFTPRTAARAVLLLVAVYGFWVFLQPLTIAGILNAGNAVGMAVCLLLGAVVLAWGRVSRALSALLTRRSGRLVAGSVAVVVGLGVVWCGVLSWRMASAMATEPDEPATLIVLGCRVEGDRPSVALLRRVDTAADYLLAHPSVQVVVSGGQGADERVSEAEAMRRVLVDRGVDEDRILVEDRSTSTLENLTFSEELLSQHGLGTSVIVVSEGYHMHRALALAERVGLDADGLAAPSAAWVLPTSWVREWFAITLDELRG